MAPSDPWAAHAVSGATSLRSHQVLVSRHDARAYGLRTFDWLELRLPTTSNEDAAPAAVLECVIDRYEEDGGGLERGLVQVHPWVLQLHHALDGAPVTVHHRSQRDGTDTNQACFARITDMHVSLLDRYPLQVTTTAGTDAFGAGSALRMALPEAIRAGHVRLPRAIQRQMRSMYGRSSAQSLTLQRGDVVPIEVLKEVYLFEIEEVVHGAAEEEDATHSVAASPSIHIVGLDHLMNDKSSDVDQVSKRLQALQLKDETELFDDQLRARLWSLGFVGYDSFVTDLLLHASLVLLPSQQQSVLTDIGSHGVLVTGVHGVGKSELLRALAQEVAQKSLPSKYIDSTTLLMEWENSKAPTPYEFLLEQLRSAFPSLLAANGVASSVGLVLLDDVDLLFRAGAATSSSGEDNDDDSGGGNETVLSPLGSALLRLLDALASTNARVCILATTRHAADIPLKAKRSGCFGKVVEMIVPTEAMRRVILQRHLQSLMRVDDTGSTYAQRMAALTGGYVAKDLVRICRNALVHAQREPLAWSHLVHAQQHIKPSQLRELNVASPADDATMTLAGYTQLQSQLHELVEWRFRPTSAMTKLGVGHASGVLLYGPSGCGKSALAKAVAARARVNYVAVKSSELMSKYFGDSEKAVRQLFARARAASPCVLFFDEFDAMVQKRSFGGEGADGDSGGGVHARMLSTFLNEMDGVGSRTGKGAGDVLVLAATNRIDSLDAALMRPGRIDKTFELAYPTREDTQAILAHHTAKMPLAIDVDLQALTDRSTGYSNMRFSGADLAAVCKEAALRALREDVDATTVTMQNFMAAWDHRVLSNPRGK
ncbi:TPA: hypothetical protein N0F65_012995 [Lagenidium giganteum]|uniref:AAA+ ATPase domain-containing protein n=1 Tax=Lagenidium giganteum TaxID=4803 RepID=A0AAV2YJS8_9STRA|nr:TPA: hypothetical protein N0F65_012995 [Lagenidium giganteum]